MSDREIIESYKLKDPIVLANNTIETLDFCAPKVMHYKKVEKAGGGEVAQICTLIQELTGKSAHIIEQLSYQDFLEVQKLVLGFTVNKSLGTTGETLQ